MHRREALKWLGVLTAGGVLAGCRPLTPTEPQPTSTETPLELPGMPVTDYLKAHTESSQFIFTLPSKNLPPVLDPKYLSDAKSSLTKSASLGAEVLHPQGVSITEQLRTFGILGPEQSLTTPMLDNAGI